MCITLRGSLAVEVRVEVAVVMQSFDADACGLPALVGRREMWRKKSKEKRSFKYPHSLSIPKRNETIHTTEYIWLVVKKYDLFYLINGNHTKQKLRIEKVLGSCKSHVGLQTIKWQAVWSPFHIRASYPVEKIL